MAPVAKIPMCAGVKTTATNRTAVYDNNNNNNNGNDEAEDAAWSPSRAERRPESIDETLEKDCTSTASSATFAESSSSLNVQGTLKRASPTVNKPVFLSSATTMQAEDHGVSTATSFINGPNHLCPTCAITRRKSRSKTLPIFNRTPSPAAGAEAGSRPFDYDAGGPQSRAHSTARPIVDDSDQKTYPRISRPVELMRGSYDCVVIGSGYGGAVAASRMARAGQSVCVLELGKERWPGEYPVSATEGIKELHCTGDLTPSAISSGVNVDVGSPTGMYHLIFGKGQNAVVCNGESAQQAHHLLRS